MMHAIQKYLAQVQADKQIEILFACEAGSRAWGFPSPNSDYDIRFIYKHPVNWYLQLQEPKDSIEMMLDDNHIDLSGWDLRKALRLLQKSNPPLLEQIQSPIIYLKNESFLAGIKALAQSSYSKIATLHHYLSMAKKMYEEIQGKNSVKLKKLFYALRAAMACLWVLEREEPPPTLLLSMLETLSLDEALKLKIQRLIQLKSEQEESYLHLQEKDLNLLIEYSIQKAEQEAKNLSASKGNMEALNHFFIQMLYSQ